MPFHLTHTDIVKGDTQETVFMLSGSDNKVHMYREVNDEHSFKEGETGEHFPELANLPSVVMWLDIRYYDNSKRRITVTGHQDGLLLVSIVIVETLEVEHKYHVEFDNPITYAVTFTITNSVLKPANISTHDDSESTLVPRRPELNILVLSALVPGTIYRDVLKRGLRDHIFLPDSNKFDAILTGCVIDIDFDGENEILIGTYGQEVLAYKLSATKPHRLRKSSSNPENTIDLTTSLPEAQLRRFAEKTDYVTTQKLDLDSRLFRSQEDIPSSVTSDSDFLPLSTSKNTMIPNSHYLPRVQSTRSSPSKDVTGETSCWLLWQRSFPYPVMGINCLDIMGDGMEDLVIVTLKGLHILQPDLGEVANVVLDRLRLLGDQLEARDYESYYGPDSFDGVEERLTQFPFDMPAKEHKSASLHN
ncbi:hypothetical protein DPMN_099502 [Dreissena polymorpha]|uniref:Kaptin n=1 Tax=Dreissena polymorpha TaxID=45954 RepID=A0A9D4R7Q1_DREPO|nr:hypothetical protein DPMN_099502 [Dreissena polymorpha]